MKRKPVFRIYKIEMQLISYKICTYFDGKQSFLKELKNLREQNNNVVGYKYIRGEYKLI